MIIIESLRTPDENTSGNKAKSALKKPHGTIKMKTTDTILSMLSDWLNGMILASFTYSAGFILRLERDVLVTNKPNVLFLTIRSSAIFDSKEEWSDFVNLLPMKTQQLDEDEPAVAYRLMLNLGKKIKKIEFGGNNTLILYIANLDGEKLLIPGVDDVWEESWVVEELEELAGHAKRTILCDAFGKIFYVD